jgi:hypothetical protein
VGSGVGVAKGVATVVSAGVITAGVWLVQPAISAQQVRVAKAARIIACFMGIAFIF